MKTPQNLPCRCGSGKKYKKCCMTQDEQAKAAAKTPLVKVSPRAARAALLPIQAMFMSMFQE